MSNQKLKTQPASHTPGPWFSEGSAVYTKQGAHYVAETEIEQKSFTKRGSEAKANAHLIAAAPELLEALEGILECAENDVLRQTLNNKPCRELLIRDLSALINKARGES